MPADTLEDGTPVKQFKFSSGTSDTEKKLQVTSFLQTVKLLKNAGFFFVLPLQSFLFLIELSVGYVGALRPVVWQLT